MITQHRGTLGDIEGLRFVLGGGLNLKRQNFLERLKARSTQVFVKSHSFSNGILRGFAQNKCPGPTPCPHQPFVNQLGHRVTHRMTVDAKTRRQGGLGRQLD